VPVLLLIAACSFGPTPKGGGPPGRSAIAQWLRDADRAGVSFKLSGRISASGHEKQGEVDMTAGSVHLILFDGVLYGQAAGSTKWLEMGAAQANFLWPAMRLSLVREAILLSRSPTSPFTVARDQAWVLGGGSGATRAEISIPPSLHEVRVVLDASQSVLDLQRPDGEDIRPPPSATPGDVLSLFAPGIAA
jgi:hypothetical protein